MGFLSKLLGWVKKKNHTHPVSAPVPSTTSCPHSAPYVILDTETTGLSPKDDAILQLTAIKYNKEGVAVACYDTYLNPGSPIPPRITKINGITDAMVCNAPTAREVEEEFLSFLGDSLIVGYNVRFDLRFLHETFPGSFDGRRYVDVLTIVRQMVAMPSYKLSDVSGLFGFQPEGRYHNARTDCEAVAAILHHIGDDLAFWASEFHGPAERTEAPYISPVLEDGHEEWRHGNDLRISGKIEEALLQFDIAREKGYRKPWLYESYAKAFRKLRAYEKEAAILQEAMAQFESPIAEEFLPRLQRAQELQRKKELREAEEQERAQQRQLRAAAKAEKLAAAQARTKPIRTRHVIQSLDNGDVIAEFDSVAAASRETGIGVKSIRDAATGRQKHAGGYCWKYADNPKEPDCEPIG